VVHCLVYGKNPEQLELARAGQFQDRVIQGRVKGCLTSIFNIKRNFNKHFSCYSIINSMAIYMKTEISGLVIVPDGMKIIKIQRQDNPNVNYYVIDSGVPIIGNID
jgi:hypothetical protein